MLGNRKKIYLIGFLFAIPIALTSYVNSSLLESLTNPLYTSAAYVLASILTILALILIPRLLTRIGNYKSVLWFIGFTFLSMLTLGVSKDPGMVLSAFIVYFIATNLVWASLDIFIEEYTSRKSVGRSRGLYLTVINGAWVVAQMISGSIIAKSSFSGIYLASTLFVILVCLAIVFFMRKFTDPKYKHVAIGRTLKIFFRNKNISKVYLINLMLKLFFAWMVIYTPIYLRTELLFNWGEIGIIFTIMLLPFVLLQAPLGARADKLGERKVLILAFFIAAMFTFLIPFIRSTEVYIWAAVLFMTRVGAAAIEIMSESYFFRIVDEEEADEITFFRNTTPVSYIIAPLIAIPVLAFAPSFKYIFFVLAAFLLIGVYLSLRLKKVK